MNHFNTTGYLFSAILVVLFFSMLPAEAAAADMEISRVGEWGHGHMVDVFTVGQYAYCLAGIDLVIVDITDPANPVETGFIEIEDVNGVYVLGDYAYIARGGPGLRIIDVSNPAAPSLIGSCDTPGTAEDVYVTGGYAYVAVGTKGLNVVDVSDPASPTIVGERNTPGYASAVHVDGAYAYVADEQSGLQIIDVADPTSPSITGSHSTSGWAIDVIVAGNYAYVVDDENGLQIIDVSDAASPSLTGSWSPPGWSNGVYVTGAYAYLVSDRFDVIDISDPANPASVSHVSPPGGLGIHVSGSYAYAADWQDGLWICDISDPFNPSVINFFPCYFYCQDVCLAGDYAYVVDGDSGLQVLDVSNPEGPVLTGSYDTPDYASGVCVSGSYAYVADGNSGLQVINVSNPANPTLAGSCNTPGSAGEVFVSSGYAYVADGNSGLQVINVSNPANPSLAGSYDTPGSAQMVFVSGDYAYVADGNSGLQILSVSDPANPTLVGSYNTPAYADGVYVSGAIAYVADKASGLQIIDVSDPANPALISSYDTPDDARDVVVSGDYAYVANTGNGVLVMDVSDPANPLPVGSYDTPGHTRRLFVSGNYVYVADSFTSKMLVLLCLPRLQAPDLSFPVDGGTVYTSTVELAWIDTNAAKGNHVPRTTGQEAGYEVRIRPQGGSYAYYQLGADTTAYTVSGLTYGTTYEWNVRALGNDSSTADSYWGNSETDWTFQVQGVTLNPPVLLSPVDGAVDQTTSPAVQWQDTNFAGKSQESGFQVRWRLLGGTGYTTQNLPAGTLSLQLPELAFYTSYEWNVRALGNGTSTLDSDWANSGSDWTFRTAGETLNAPVLLSPANGATGQPIDITLLWQDTNGLGKGQEDGVQVRYRQLGTTTYTNIYLASGATSTQVTGLDTCITYEWNVRALGNGTTTLHSDWANGGENWTFLTKGQTLNTPVLLSPPDGATDQPLTTTLHWQDTNGKAQETWVQVRWRRQGAITYATQDLGAGTTSFQPAGLDYNVTYEWNVRALGNGTSTLDSDWANSGADWSFTTLCTNTSADAGEDKTIVCGETSVTIGGLPTASGGEAPYTFAWLPAAGLNDPAASNPSASPASSTLYTVIVTDVHGCSDTDNVLVTKAQDLPAPAISYPGDGALAVPIAPEITWTQVANNFGYCLLLMGDDIVDTEIDLAQDETTCQVLDALLSYGHTYSIQAKTLGNGSTYCSSPYGTANTFTVETLPCTHMLPFAAGAQKDGFRTNLGLLELPSHCLTASLSFLSASGTVLEQTDYALDAYAYMPISDITSSLGITEDVSITICACGPFMGIGGLVDNTTDDPSVVGSELAQFTQGFTPLVLKTGDWNTQLVLRNMADGMASVTLSAIPISGGAPCLQESLTINGNGFFACNDIIAFLGGATGDVFLLDISANREVCGYARQYTTNHTGGIYPCYGHGSGATTLVFPYMEDTAAYRSNIGLVRTAAGAANATLHYYTGGSLQASRTTGIAENQYLPIINALRWIKNSTSADPLDESGYVVIEADAPVYAIGGPTDNMSNDPSVQGASYSAFADTLAPIVLKSGPWSTRLVLTNHSAAATGITLELIYDGVVAASYVTAIGAYDQVQYNDIIGELFPAYAYGTLRIQSDDPIYAYVHQYTSQHTGGIYPVFNTCNYE